MIAKADGSGDGCVGVSVDYRFFYNCSLMVSYEVC